MLLKPENPSIILYDESGKVMWRDGSASQPIKLPAMQFGDVASTQYLVTYNESGELERVPVVPVEVTICPTVGSPFIAHVLAIPQ